MAARAVRAFREQTYQNKRLYVLDTGNENAGYFLDDDDVSHRWADISLQTWSIGRLRNEACHNNADADIFIHWDDDDWSHPSRIAEQVAHLQLSGADVVGYDELLFWDGRIVGRIASEAVRITENGIEADVNVTNGEAWIYRNKLAKAGTSFCYKRSFWESRFCHDLPRPERGACGEDWAFAAGAGIARVSGVGDEPRIIASIHGGNTSAYEIVEGANWHRAPEFDDYCRERMKL